MIGINRNPRPPFVSGRGGLQQAHIPPGSHAGSDSRMPILYDCDNDSDCGDAASLPLLLQLEAQGECRIVSVTVASENTKAAPCTRVMLNYAGRSGIPLGAFQGTGRISDSASSYNSGVVSTLGAANGVSTSAVRSDYSSAVSVMRQALANLSGTPKAKIIVVGTLTNISDLLDSSADGISPLDGIALVAAKVSEIHCMGGAFPTSDVDEHNITFDVTSANNFATKTPVPVYWQGYHIGDTINTGPPTYSDTARDPFKLAFSLSSQTVAKSYDQMAVLAAIRPSAGYFTYTGPGDVTFSSGVGNTSWSANPSGKHLYSTKAISDGTFTTIINDLLAELDARLDQWGPTWTSSTTASVPENSVLAYSMTASETSTFSIIGGADQSKFEISGSTLRWLNDGTKDFEAPDDADANNTYIVTLRATDHFGHTTDQTVTVTVTNVNESSFSPADLSPALWLAADDLTTLFQTITGTTAVASNGDVVGTWKDKSGAAFDLTAAANDTTRPVYHTDGGAGSDKPYVSFDGSNDCLRRTAGLGSFAAGACSIFVAVRGNPATAGRLYAEGRTADALPSYCLMQAGLTTASHGAGFVRNDAGTLMENNVDLTTSTVWDNTDNVYGVVDDGSHYTPYLDGVAGSATNYTRAGTITTDRTAVGAQIRTSTANFFAGFLYEIVVVHRALNSTEIANLTTYLGAKMGRTL